MESRPNLKGVQIAGVFGIIACAVALAEFPLWFMGGSMPQFSETSAFGEFATRHSTLYLTRTFMDLFIFGMLVVFFGGFRHLVVITQASDEWNYLGQKQRELVNNDARQISYEKKLLHQETYRMADLNAVLKELERERNRLEEAIRLIRSLWGRQGRGGRAGKRQLSPAARKRIAAAQKARWAKWRARQKKAA